MDLCWQSNGSDFNVLSRLVIAFLPRSKCLLISLLQSPSAVILDPKKIKSVTVSIVSLSFAISWSLLRLMSVELVMPYSHLILCRPLLLLPSVFPSIRVFSNELVVCIRWPKYRSFSFSIPPSNENSGLISFRMDWLDLLEKGLPRVFSNTIIQKHQFLGAQPSLWSNSHIHT